ncbi:ribosomal L7Ae/L30e/S12e/Gadd45 family protein [uncultured Selenomonas sp.]|uniref:L7Ae/L30e/S12e/Gadd45 family ribosomal protein n=1 Tax=uncultured Selenomonas sp. TaxID=159275 RepID=UPI0028DB48E4|nr:ribosomal L7Ae/L30e/S12e/Gadd45 family protein [uncultured Selenomonas sp.]
MTLESLKGAARVIGVKQVTKAVQKSQADAVFLADDADGRVTEPLLHLADEIGVPVVHVPTMQELGKACSIEVGAAAAAVLKS